MPQDKPEVLKEQYLKGCMELSEEYIKMCNKAGDTLRQHWIPMVGDYVYETLKYRVMIFTRKASSIDWWATTAVDDDKDSTIPNFEINRNDCLWIPRQDQLLSLINCTHDTGYLVKFIEWVDDNWGEHAVNFYSMERLMLMYYMEICYKEHWNNQSKKFEFEG